MQRPTCIGYGEPIKPMRGVPGVSVHASRTVAACDLDADHVPMPARDASEQTADHPTRGQADTSGYGLMGPLPPGWISKCKCGTVPCASPVIPT